MGKIDRRVLFKIVEIQILNMKLKFQTEDGSRKRTHGPQSFLEYSLLLLSSSSLLLIFMFLFLLLMFFCFCCCLLFVVVVVAVVVVVVVVFIKDVNYKLRAFSICKYASAGNDKLQLLCHNSSWILQ